MERRWIALDGNEATASVAHRSNEVIAIYPITPSSNMGEFADEWSAKGKRNIWGVVPQVIEMQSEGGAIGTVHGALQAGSLATTFTASQGLLLMIPNLFKIAGELTSFCMHVAARTVATHALSIFGDHSDVMACRQTGFALLSSGSVQEAHDFALIGQAATLHVTRPVHPLLRRLPHVARSREDRSCSTMTTSGRCCPTTAIAAHRARALTPDHPGAARHRAESRRLLPGPRGLQPLLCSPVRASCSDVMDEFARLTGRRYRLFDYVGHPEAERVIVLMGSGVETVARNRGALRGPRREGRRAQGTALPPVLAAATSSPPCRRPPARWPSSTARRSQARSANRSTWTSSPALVEARAAGTSPFATEPRVIGGRYGLSSKEFTPAMVAAVFDELKSLPSPRSHFTVGITDDVTRIVARL